ncbi:ferredoxin [Bradyrhizobium sp. AZCC 2230]|jgi:ferredoxin|uniref:ferredoxin n=1 Tax=Bradyrhizobium sp. AZCC 2230 TaxID=3117021 RepID=UPI002FEEF7D5
MRITVNRLRCIAAGQCVLKSPHVFDQDEQDGIVVLLTENPAPEFEASARLAARVCPSEAITVHDE